MPARSWVNLRYAGYASDAKLYYANPGARLTPVSMTIGCLYLAETQETAFRELYGDLLWTARQNSAFARITDTELEERVFIPVATRDLVLCDLVSKNAAEAIGFDAGTLYASDLKFPQTFAERIYHHPRKVDGIRYRSRHSSEECVVIWERSKGSELARIEGPWSFLKDNATAKRIDVLELYGETLQVVASVT